jgi:hypothetical protein
MPRLHVLDFYESTLHSYRFFTHDTLTAITLHLPPPSWFNSQEERRIAVKAESHQVYGRGIGEHH